MEQPTLAVAAVAVLMPVAAVAVLVVVVVALTGLLVIIQLEQLILAAEEAHRVTHKHRGELVVPEL
jgi:hypothetical protein